MSHCRHMGRPFGKICFSFTSGLSGVSEWQLGDCTLKACFVIRSKCDVVAKQRAVC